jgi:hypothetical protein
MIYRYFDEEDQCIVQRPLLEIELPSCHLIQIPLWNASLLRQDQHIVLPNIQHVPDLGPRKNEPLQLAEFDLDLSGDALFDLGYELPFMVRDLAFIGFVGSAVVHLARPQMVVYLLSRDDVR